MSDSAGIDLPAHIAKVRTEYGDDFVAGRATAEEKARSLLNASAGNMSREQAMQLGQFLNEHVSNGVLRHDRFSPAFVGGALNKLTADLATFNDRVQLLWKGNDDSALAALDQSIKNRQLFPGAGSSFPSVLMYLREPNRFAIWTTATIAGLRALTGSSGGSKVGGSKSYLQFCELVNQFRALHDVAPQEVDAILADASRIKPLPPADPPVPSPANASLEQLASACALPVEMVEEWVQLLQGAKRQAIFYGPPGTGKTYIARLLAQHLAGDPARVRTVQFHPSYSYEDFVEGLRPDLKSETGGALSYVIRPGLFQDLCTDAAADKDNSTFVLIIDELNRADLGSVLGELMMLLEYRGETTVELPYSKKKFSIPSNIIVLATMNTADRSLALVDFAMRRRFHAIELRPNREALTTWLTARVGVDAVDPALKFFDRVQAAIGLDSPFAPGHSFWMIDTPNVQELQRVWKYEVRPYLEEFWFESPERVNQLDTDIQELLGEEA